MTLIYLLITVYIFAINFYAYRLVKTQRDDFECGGDVYSKQDGKLILAGILGGATAVYAGMFLMRFRLSNLLLMLLMPILAVLNFYSFFLAYRGVYLFL